MFFTHPHMNRAFIFDMDGVLVDSERAWEPLEKPMLERVLGEKTAEHMGSTVGLNATQVFEKAKQFGSTVRLEDVLAGYEAIDPIVYQNAQITPGVDALIEALDLKGYKIGLVTQSSQSCVDMVLRRLSSAKKIEQTISLLQHPELRPKPNPDGYIEILKQFNAEPKHSFVLEDSNTGIQAAKSAGAFVIGFRGNLVEGYQQAGADAYADMMEDVVRIIDSK
jgi:HAD superfamily hydrolase (TIGR01509 family)